MDYVFRLTITNLPDDEMIKQVAENPGRDQEEKARFKDGLLKVIGTLREDNVNEPNAVATAILAYRAQFVNDPSRVLNL